MTVVEGRADMDTLLSALTRELNATPLATAFAGSDDGATDYLEYAEYRIVHPDGRRELLDLCHVPAQRSLVAALWSPDDLTTATAAVSVEDVALRYRVWRYDEESDPAALAHEVADEVADWVAADGACKPTGGDGAG